MPFFHLRSLSGTVWPPVPAAEVNQVWAAYQELDRTQWLSGAEVEELQLKQLGALLLHCFNHVPYYHRALSEAGISARPIESLSEFRRLPLLTRHLYQAQFPDLQARSLPADMRAEGHVEVQFPDYELGERCPILTARVGGGCRFSRMQSYHAVLSCHRGRGVRIMRIAPLADVKARLSAYLDQCSAEGPIVITRNGKAVAVLLAPYDDDDLERLMLGRSRRFQALLNRSS